MNWFDKNDSTLPVISAKSHINSSHGNQATPTYLIFELGMAMEHLETAFAAEMLIERLPAFQVEAHLYNEPCPCDARLALFA